MKKIRNIAAALILFAAMSVNALAASPEVVFTADKNLEYRGVTQKEGAADLGEAFKDIAPGEERSAVITVKNENSHAVNFYMSTEVLKALEETGKNAKGAAYDITLKVGDATVYDSRLGGYTEQLKKDDNGLADMNKMLEDSIFIGTFEKNDEKNVSLNIFFDGEAFDNDSAADYSLTTGKLAFEFKVSYDDPATSEVKYQVVERKHPGKIETIYENVTPLAAVATGDKTPIVFGSILIAAGLVLIVFALRKNGKDKATEESR
ncbi:MAG: hypothetical protein K6F84_04295 [Lachnospiraceae bacterium]|nr:hypothetical protein [Lachnospiraceae bacterium]